MEISTQFLVLVPLVLGVTEVIKGVGLPSRFAPLCALILGVLGSVFLIGGEAINALILQGLIAGLSASGLWSSAKAVVLNA